VIEAKNLTKRFGKQLVFENLNFTINDGEFISLIGPNGSGKTTLVKIIMGLEKETSGELLMDRNKLLAMSLNLEILTSTILWIWSNSSV